MNIVDENIESPRDACKLAGLKAPGWTTTPETIVKLAFLLNVKPGGATKSTKKKHILNLKTIPGNECRRTPDYRTITNLGIEKTMERYINQLKDVGFIEFNGAATQTGVYYLTGKI